MAYEIPGNLVSLQAGADLSSRQYQAVKVNSSGKIILGSVAGESVLGILQDSPASGATGSVMTSGVTMAAAGGTIAAGAKVTIDANGKVVAATNQTLQLHRSLTLDVTTVTSATVFSTTITVTGAVTGDFVTVAAPAALETGLGFCAFVSAADTVTLRVINPTAGNIDPASGTWALKVDRKNDEVLGVALEGGADGQIITVDLDVR